jgi:hypothetical protein
MLAHRLAISTRKLRPQFANALVQLLYLWLSQDGTGSLVLQSVHKSREEVDVLGFDGGQFVVTLRRDKRRGSIRWKFAGGRS